MNSEQRGYILKIARDSIAAALSGGAFAPQKPDDKELTAECGAFVTLTSKGALRGCIGNIRGFRPLYQTVSEMAVAAATEDPRFPPMKQAELDDLHIEISVLSPFEKVEDPALVEVGRDGLYIKRGSYSGLLLPQVATEWKWDRNTFLSQTCSKAGLPTDAWKLPDTEIYSFTAEVFGEGDEA